MDVCLKSLLNFLVLYIYLYEFCVFAITPEDEGVKYASKCEGNFGTSGDLLSVARFCGSTCC
jgi:hypothetical protein